jgi:hypothetical protein
MHEFLALHCSSLGCQHTRNQYLCLETIVIATTLAETWGQWGKTAASSSVLQEL